MTEQSKASAKEKYPTNKRDAIHREFWKEIIYKKNGKINERQVMKELIDFSDMMDRFAVFLEEATGGRMSKLNYTTEAMLACLQEHLDDCIKDALEDEKERRVFKEDNN